MLQYVLPIAFFSIFLALIGLGVLYMARRFSIYFQPRNSKLFHIVLSSLAVYMVIAIPLFSNWEFILADIGYILAVTFMGFLFYLFLSVFVCDILRRFLKIPLRIVGVLSVSMAVMISLYGLWNARNLKINRVNVSLPGLTKEMKVVHLSDIHLGRFRGASYLELLIRRIHEIKPDAVFITGDLFDSRIGLNLKTLEPLKKLHYPVYFVGGNHELYADADLVNEYLKQLNVRVLENESVLFKEVQIAGLRHMRADEGVPDIHSAGKDTMKEVLAGLVLSDQKPVILLNHAPYGLSYASRAGVDLFLAGHTHGGQIFPFNYVSRIFFPYNRGLYTYENMKVFVSQGAGTFGPPMRVGTNCEMVILTLEPVK